MIRLALPKGRNLDAALRAFGAAGFALGGSEGGAGVVAIDDRRLRRSYPELGLETLLLKDRDLPIWVERGVADCGVVGRDVLDEADRDLLVPVELAAGRCRLALIGPRGAAPPAAGAQLRLATKYPRAAARWLAHKAWSAEILELSGSIELAPVLGLADLILDIVQTGATLAAHDLVELETVAEIAPCFVVQRAAWQVKRPEILNLIERLEGAGVAA